MNLIKVVSIDDLRENRWVKPKSSDNLYQIMFWDNDIVTVWGNNSRITKRININSFIKNWFIEA